MSRLILPLILAAICFPGSVAADSKGDLEELYDLREHVNQAIAELESDSVTTRARINSDDGAMGWNDKVMLKTREGYYLRAKLGGGNNVNADIRKPGTSEIFNLEWLSPTTVRLRTRNGHYVGARGGGGHNVDAIVEHPRSSEVFTVEWANPSHTKLRLRTREGFYIHPIKGGGGDVDARTKFPGTSEVLTIIAAS